MLAKCVNCEFYVSANEKFCLNCGLSAPAKELQKNSDEFERNLTITIAFALAIVFSFVLLFLRSDGKFDNLSELPVILIGSLLFAFAFAVLISAFVANRLSKREFNNRFAYLKVDRTLTGTEDTITMRNYELDKKYRETEGLLKAAKKSGQENAAEKLRTARELILAQIARYELQSQKIRLIRMQNKLRPILYNRNFSKEETVYYAETVDETTSEIEDMRQSLTNDYAIEFPETVQPEKHSFLSQLNETQASCEKLRKFLLANQTRYALQEVSPFQENLSFPNEEITLTAETFNIQTTLTDFSESFNELETDYKRLEAKEEMRQKLL